MWIDFGVWCDDGVLYYFLQDPTKIVIPTWKYVDDSSGVISVSKQDIYKRADEVLGFEWGNFLVPVCQVYNQQIGYPAEAPYIGRGSGFGNPYKIGEHGTRKEVCRKFAELLSTDLELVRRVQKELRGKDLVCHCKPKQCHGDILLRVANMMDISVCSHNDLMKVLEL